MSTLAICIIIFILSLTSYLLNLVPMAVTSLATMAALIITGCLDTNTALAGFGNTNVVIIAGMFIIAAGLNRTMFIDKISAGIIKLAGGSYKRAYLGYLILAALLANFIASPMVVFSIVFPLCSSMCRECGVSPSKTMFPLVVVSIGSTAILPTSVAVSLSSQFTGFLKSYGFTDITFNPIYFTWGRLPMMIIVILWAYFIAPKFAPDQPVVPITASGGPSIAEKKPLKPFSEAMGSIIFFGTLFFLIFGSKIVPAWEVCFIGAILVVLCGVLNEKEAYSNMPMSIIFIYVGALAMGNALNATGAGQVVGDWLAGVVGNTHNNYILGLLFFCIPFILTQFMLNQGVMAVFIPICLLAAKSLKANPIGLMILVLSGCLTAFATPMATPAIPMAMGAGGYDIKSLIKQSWLISIIMTVSYVFYTMTVYPAF